MSDMQTGITVPVNAPHPSSWQEKPRWLIACLCWRERRFHGLLKRQKREPQNIHSLWKRHVKSLPPSTTLLPFFFFLPAPLSNNVSWIKSDQPSGIIFLPLSYNKPHSSAILKCKLKRQESSKTFPYVSVWFQTEVTGGRLMSPDVCACLKYTYHSRQWHFSLSKCPLGMQSEFLSASSSLWF